MGHANDGESALGELLGDQRSRAANPASRSGISCNPCDPCRPNQCSPEMEPCLPDVVCNGSAEKDYLTGLDFLWLEITPKCNLECVHCYVSSTPHLPVYGDMDFEDWTRVMDEAFASGCRKLQFIGGEPTLHPALPNLIEYADDTGYDLIEVYSNGTVLTDELKESYIHHNVELAFSVYAPEAEEHEAVTQRPGSFKKTIRTIGWALDKGVEVRASVIDMPRTTDYVESTREYLMELGIKSVGVDRVRGIGRGIELATDDDPFRELCGDCWKGKLCVTASGDIYPCIMARTFRVGSSKESIRSVLEGAPLADFRRRQGAYTTQGE